MEDTLKREKSSHERKEKDLLSKLQDEKAEVKKCNSKQSSLVKENQTLTRENKSLMLDLFASKEHQVNENKIQVLKLKVVELEK